MKASVSKHTSAYPAGQPSAGGIGVEMTGVPDAIASHAFMASWERV